MPCHVMLIFSQRRVWVGVAAGVGAAFGLFLFTRLVTPCKKEETQFCGFISFKFGPKAAPKTMSSEWKAKEAENRKKNFADPIDLHKMGKKEQRPHIDVSE